MLSIVFGLGTAIFFAASGLMYSRTAKRIGALSSVAWFMLVGLVITLPFTFLAGIPENLPQIWPLMVVSGVGNLLGLVVVGYAFRVGKVGIVSPIVATEGAVAAILATIAGESIAPIVALLLTFMVLGVVVSAIAKDPQPLENERRVLAVVLATLGSATFGIALFTTGLISDDLPIPWILLPSRLVAVVALAIPLALAGKMLVTRSTAPLVVAIGFAEVLGFVCFAIGAQSGVAVTSVLASQFGPIAAVMAYVLFKERLGRLQIAGVTVLVICVSALALVSSSPNL